MPSTWNVYMLRTATGALYTGITTDVERRLKEHASGNKGAKSLRGKGPLSFVLELPAVDRSEASCLEARIKQLSKEDKERLVSGNKHVLAAIRD